jgi:uncharacterized protein (TIGR00725 family)
MPVPAIAVCGASRIIDANVSEIARAVGAGIMRAGCTVVCGGRDGVMEAVCRGAAEARAAGAAGGFIVGILPGATKDDANPWCDVVIPTGIGYARNSIVALAGDAVIFVGGGSGTLSELAYAWQFGKPMVAVVPSGGWAASLAGKALDDRRGDWIVAAASAEEAVQKAVELAHLATGR